MAGTTHVNIRRVSKNKTVEEVVSTKCNTCPEITFKADGTGYIKAEGGEKLLDIFNWKVSGNKLFFTNGKPLNQEADTLASGSYIIMPSTELLGGRRIDLVDDKDTKHSLVRIN
jgi:hypothetical protein